VEKMQHLIKMNDINPRTKKPYKWSIETRKKISVLRKKLYDEGKYHKPPSRVGISTHKGKKWSEITFKKHPRLGKTHSDKTKLLIGLKSKGRTKSELFFNVMDKFKGENNPAWKGGIISKGNYVLIYSPTHPFKTKDNYVLEHRLVMEKHIGRILLKHEVVHHINNNGKDNRIENLMLFESNATHLNFHKNNRIKLKNHK
jgi:hypothetical protein